MAAKFKHRLFSTTCKTFRVGTFAMLLYINFTCRPTSNEESSVKENIKRNVKSRIDNGYSVGTALAFIDGDQVEYFSYGYKDTTKKEAVSQKSTFEIGSVTKTFTALLLADLVEKRVIALDDPVEKFFPDSVEIPNYLGRKITFVDLATHMSGLPREPINFHPTDLNNPYAAEDVKKLYDGLRDYQLTRGANKYEYSNLGIELLGQTLVLTSGKSFEKMLQEIICDPLQMKETSTKNDNPLLTTGHMGTTPVAHWDLRALQPAGGIRSNVEDLVKFVKAQMGLSRTDLATAIELTQRPMALINGNTRIGLVWNITSVGNDEIISHSGATGGYRAYIAFSKKTKKGIIILNNSGQHQDDLGMYFFDQAVKVSSATHPILVPSLRLRANVGIYKLSREFNGKTLNQQLDVKLENNQLFVKSGGLPYVPIYPKSESVFFTKGPEAFIEFIRNKDGRVDKMLLSQAGRTFTAFR
jgi:CubicO group peptidase (beta-lactamase class C family)